MEGQYILIGQTPSPCEDLLEWARWFEQNERRVRLTRVGPYFVSTIFLGLDHNFGRRGAPLLFETMVWVEMDNETAAFTLPAEPGVEPFTLPAQQWHRDFLDEQRRCSTWLEAEAQHQAVIDEMRETCDDVEQLWPEAIKEELCAKDSPQS